eukprot:13910689-Alexandrium_andersonii.AAC.1
MSASLVGSEMCIRDSSLSLLVLAPHSSCSLSHGGLVGRALLAVSGGAKGALHRVRVSAYVYVCK